LIIPITGLAQVAISRLPRPLRILSSSAAVWRRSSSRCSWMSPPAEKARPAPVTTTQAIESSASNVLTASRSSLDRRRFIALSLSGRFSVTMPTPSSASTRICS
jgi:hypothetical protein